MNDEHDKADAERPDDDGPLGGERLAQARRERQISVLEVAKELHLDEPKVRALERNDFDVLGAPVFAKGHLRKYAQLVGVSEADIFADYYAMTRAAPLPPLVAARSKIRDEVSPGPWIAVVAVLLVAAGAYWWFVERERPVTPPAEPPQTEEALPELLRPEQLQPEELLPEEPPRDPATGAEQKSAPPARAEAPPLLEGQVSLSLFFSGDCWTEIIDATGRRLYFNMGRSGQSATVRGVAPISALFGNADNVRVQVNGADYALPTPSSANRTVRVAIVSS